MPAYQTMIPVLNEMFGPNQIGELDPGLFDEGQPLSGALPDNLSQLGVVLDGLPSGIHEAVRAVIKDAISRNMPITLAWAPAYDVRLNLWDVADTTDTRGGITMLIETRYPGDDRPVN